MIKESLRKPVVECSMPVLILKCTAASGGKQHVSTLWVKYRQTISRLLYVVLVVFGCGLAQRLCYLAYIHQNINNTSY